MTGGRLSEHAVKLEMIRSISRSQAALAAILESIAELTGHSELTARKLSDNIRILSGYQSAMCRMMSGISLHRPKRGTPAAPWLNKTKTWAEGTSKVHGVQEE
ncbi:hypothetical protein A8L34_20680 [Bacillus sp. FJAT-27264]|uniref:hypothetical protein n=1 Tax=Paenibacillus sp. (strain DSM 101736 / FJAT-27264) TaxID=1850362 RepID=UPI00080801ED|nr:hypothetical protein [Bacillus sp. FJAT-27264]OBZ09695.1 hypothetical protein A8L34_20680 [Bacillus sp. FJAT-27264]